MAVVLFVCVVFVRRADAPSAVSKFADVTIGQETLHVELAQTQSEQMKGLSDRDEIGSDGMLFFFPESQSVKFWMKDMRFALDMVWILDTTIVGIDRDVLPPTVGRDIEVRQSPGLISAVLEVEAGGADSWAIGQTVSVSY